MNKALALGRTLNLTFKGSPVVFSKAENEPFAVLKVLVLNAALSFPCIQIFPRFYIHTQSGSMPEHEM